MSLTTRVGLLAGASALTLTGASLGSQTATETSTEALRAEVAALKAQVARLSEDENWLTEQRSDEIRSLVQDVLSDADTRASLLQSGMTAGYDDGFVIGSADGNFTLKINGLLQARFVYNNQDNGPGWVPDFTEIPTAYAAYAEWEAAASEAWEDLVDLGLDPDDADDYDDIIDWWWDADQEELRDTWNAFRNSVALAFGATFDDDGNLVANDAEDDDRWGFENSRTKLRFSGNVVSPAWMYFIEADFGTGGGFTLDDAYIAHDCGNGWTGKMGQMKSPLLREDLVWSGNQLLVERSVVNGIFSGGRMQGLVADYMGDQFHFTAAIGDGVNSANTWWGLEDTEWALTGRGEYLFAGTWDQFADFTSWNGEEFGFLLGGAAHYESQEYGTSTTNNEVEFFMATIDASLEFGGANLFGAVMYRNFDDDAFFDLDQYGIVFQGGVFLNDDWELFGRYEWADLDIDAVDDISIFTVGLNRYFAGHKVKWTTDLGFGINAVSSPTAITGWRQDSLVTVSDVDFDEFDPTDFSVDEKAEDGQVVFRTQLQIAF